MKNVYIPCDKMMFVTNEVISKNDGRVIKITANHRLIYFWCKNQYEFFKALDKRYIESWESIFRLVDLAYNTSAKNIVKDLREIGLIEVLGGKRDAYKVVHPPQHCMDWIFKSPYEDKSFTPKSNWKGEIADTANKADEPHEVDIKTFEDNYSKDEPLPF